MGTTKELDEMALTALQELMEEYDAEEKLEEVIEDENIYNDDDGVLDVGELVAQLFRANLDPYPKKPGTKPINISFSM